MYIFVRSENQQHNTLDMKEIDVIKMLYYSLNGNSDFEVFLQIVESLKILNFDVTVRTLYNYKKKHHWHREYEKPTFDLRTQLIETKANAILKLYQNSHLKLSDCCKKFGVPSRTFRDWIAKNVANIAYLYLKSKQRKILRIYDMYVEQAYREFYDAANVDSTTNTYIQREDSFFEITKPSFDLGSTKFKKAFKMYYKMKDLDKKINDMVRKDRQKDLNEWVKSILN